MSNQLRFDGKVVVVTGAGGGLGRCYALMFAERGAKVVVNDLGGSMSGDGGKSSRAADLVVEEIRAKNGVAVANYDSVEDGEKIIATAIENFGRVDILINNAGILRDKSFARTSDLDWDLIHRVHLRGSFLLSRAAWPHMQKNKFGRIIMTSSGAGIYGNFGQANYSAAKLGLLGLSNTLSIEGKKYNIKCNTIAPVARSRLTQTVMPDEILDSLKPEFVAPLVLFLCHESTDENGALFEVGGGWIGKLRWQKSSGAVVTQNGQMSPENVRDKWTEITSFNTPLYHTAIGESTNYCLNPEPPVAASASAASVPANQFKYDFKDIILYNLSLGVSTRDEKSLKYLYENHEQFCVLPGFGVIPAFGSVFESVAALKMDNVQIDPAKVLHGEQYLELFKPLKAAGVLTTKAQVVDVLDKGSGASVVVNVELYDENNEKVALNQFVTFAVGSGGFGGKRDSDKIVKANTTKKFDRKPDAVVDERTTIDQAALYRLNGDFNPLHIDPSFSAVLGFERPILHGLCTFGLAIKHVLARFCDGQVENFKSVKVRFTKPVLPGQTVQTSMWLDEGKSRVYFECKVVETGTTVISGAYIDFRKPVGAPVQQVAAQPAPAKQTAASATGSGFAAEAIFDDINTKIKANLDMAKKLNAVYAFVISKKDKSVTFVADLKKNHTITKLTSGADVKADCTMLISDEDFVALASGKGNAQQLFMKGKLKIKGNIMLAQKLEGLFKLAAPKL